jgi:hypothetical protein
MCVPLWVGSAAMLGTATWHQHQVCGIVSMGLSPRRDLAVGTAAIAALAVPIVTLLGALHDAIAAHSKGRLHWHPLWRRLHKNTLPYTCHATNFSGSCNGNVMHDLIATTCT